jgi:peptidoglycan/LPS O-acetylase OafA/YrhL
LTGLSPIPEIAGIRVYDLAVYVFFSVSGFLISTSWYRVPVARVYLAKRALRIFPALIAVVTLTTFAIGPLVTTSAQYFASAQTWGYLGNVTLVATYRLPGVFDDNPLHAVNGVFWSLGPEFLCYLVVLALGVALRGRRLTAAIVMTVLLLALAVLPVQPLGETASAMVFFGIGAIIAAVRGDRRLPLWPVPVLLVLWITAAALLPALWPLAHLQLAWLFVPYTVIALGQASTPVLHRAARFGDFSYGLYLWGFLVQQVVVAVAPTLPFALNLVIVIAVTVALAVGSWHLIEKHALAAKPTRQTTG